MDTLLIYFFVLIIFAFCLSPLFIHLFYNPLPAAKFEHRVFHNYVEVNIKSQFYMFFFGGFYLMYKGLWLHALACFSTVIAGGIIGFFIGIENPNMTNAEFDALPVWGALQLISLFIWVMYIAKIKGVLIWKYEKHPHYRRVI